MRSIIPTYCLCWNNIIVVESHGTSLRMAFWRNGQDCETQLRKSYLAFGIWLVACRAMSKNWLRWWGSGYNNPTTVPSVYISVTQIMLSKPALSGVKISLKNTLDLICSLEYDWSWTYSKTDQLGHLQDPGRSRGIYLCPVSTVLTTRTIAT